MILIACVREESEHLRIFGGSHIRERHGVKSKTFDIGEAPASLYKVRAEENLTAEMLNVF